ncbi:MAG: hypothetical protein ABJB34_10910 [Acidobacteriota bacterium]
MTNKVKAVVDGNRLSLATRASNLETLIPGSRWGLYPIAPYASCYRIVEGVR